MEVGTDAANPWGGVDLQGFLRIFGDRGLVVTNAGKLTSTEFSASPALGDLNGDGLIDLVVGDPRGWVWFFANSGTKFAPKFTRGELMPLYFYSNRGEPPCIKISLADANGDGLLDLTVGDYFGNVYQIFNTGSKTSPVFHQPSAMGEARILPASAGEVPWGNFFSPCLFDWNGDGVPNLILGEGTYTANNIYLVANTGGTQSPKFTSSKRQTLISGQGREHLTPQVLDLNGDGKPDILTGEREGYVNFYANVSSDPHEPKFSEPVRLSFGTPDKSFVGPLTTFAVGDLNGDGKIDLVFGRPGRRLGVAYGRGIGVNPAFDSIVDLKGVSPFTKLKDPASWDIAGSSRGGQFHVLRLVSSLASEPSTFEKDFALAPGVDGKYALKMEIIDPVQPTFPTRLQVREPVYSIAYKGEIVVTPGVEYELRCWTKGEGFTSCTAEFRGGESSELADDSEQVQGYGFSCPINLSRSWTQTSEKISFRKRPDAKDPKSPVKFRCSLDFKGQGVFFLDQLQIVPVER